MQKKLENNEAQLKTLQDECNYYKGQLDLCKKSMMKPLLDEACQIGKFVQELGESRGHTRDTVEKQTDMVNQFWDIIKVLHFLFILLFFAQN
jgi:flagellar biosynthesis chaperone FliJ